MMIGGNVFDLAQRASRAYDQLKRLFIQFYESLEYLNKPDAHIKGVKLFESFDADHFEIDFAGLSLIFHFSVRCHTDSSLFGEVFVERKKPSFTTEADIVGVFQFNGSGITDFKSPEDNEGLEITYNAEKIVWHYVHIALIKQLP